MKKGEDKRAGSEVKLSGMAKMQGEKGLLCKMA